MRHSVLDGTHDAAQRSWIASANGHVDFPLQNLPFGIFSVGKGPKRLGTAIGDSILAPRLYLPLIRR